MKGTSSLCSYIQGIQPARITAIAVVFSVHALLGLALLSLGTPVGHDAKRDVGSQRAIRVTFLQREMASPMPVAPEPLTAPAIQQLAPELATQPLSVVDNEAPESPAEESLAVPHESLQAPSAAAERMAEEDDGSLPIRTEAPTLVAGAAQGPKLYTVGEDLPAEFLSEVDAIPMELVHYRKSNSPEYLESARAARHQGIVVLRVLVDEQGFPVGIQVVRSTAGDELAQESLRAVSEWQFKPAIKNGVAVKGTLLVPIYFFLDGMPPSLRQWRSMGGMNRTGE